MATVPSAVVVAPRTSGHPTSPGAAIAADMTSMIDRLVAGYAVLGLAPGIPQLLDQAPGLRPSWLAAVGGLQALLVLGMVVQAARRRAIGPWAGGLAGLTLVAVLTFPLAAPPVLDGLEPFLWWQAGLAVVCAGVWRGVGTSVAYGTVLAAAWTVMRSTPEGGSTPFVLGASEGVFAAAAGIVIAVVARGMLDSAATADALAAQLYARELQQAIDKALGEERTRLDQLIHDDVMTTLTAAVHSSDAATGRATALLAHETLAVIDSLESSPAEGSISVAVLASLAEQTVRRVSPDVGWRDDVDPAAASRRVPSPVAESLLAAIREAVRNAVRHAQADATTVELHAVLGSELRVSARVRDDGRGFVLAAVPPSRLGVRISVLEASRRAGIAPQLRTGPGQGTEIMLAWTGPPTELNRVMPAVPARGRVDERLPVDFPSGQFIAATWLAVAVSIGVGLATFGALRSPVAVLLTMLAVLAATFLVTGIYGSLRLPTPVTIALLALQVVIAVLMVVAIPDYTGPDILHWHSFPVELVLVTLVIRRRLGAALVGLVVFEAGVGWTSFASGGGWQGLLQAGSGHVLFVIMAVLVTTVLRTISRRQASLRAQEDEAIDDSVRRHVALVQRALWVADLRAQARAILVRLSEVDGPVPPDVRSEALLHEATLRESLVARNVMSDELAVLTERARRRGVEVRIVDSRHTVVPPPIAQALLDAVRRGLAADSVSRLVVRLAPEDNASSASVLTEDADGTHLVQLDATGSAVASRVQARRKGAGA